MNALPDVTPLDLAVVEDEVTARDREGQPLHQGRPDHGPGARACSPDRLSGGGAGTG